MTMSRPGCGSCRYFANSAVALEAALPGLSSLSSGYASVRASDGLCRVHERLVRASSVCPAYSAGSGNPPYTPAPPRASASPLTPAPPGAPGPQRCA